MITAQFRKQFKEKLGEKFNYSPPVKLILQEIGSMNRDGNHFSSQSIRNVFNGDRNNEAIEIAIMECLKREIQQKYKLQSLRSSLQDMNLTSPETDQNQ